MCYIKHYLFCVIYNTSKSIRKTKREKNDEKILESKRMEKEDSPHKKERCGEFFLF